MHKLIAATVLISVGLIAGCATTPSADGIVEIGPDTYRVGNFGRFTDYSSSALKARLYQDAYRHCAAKNKLMVPSNGANQSSGTQSSEMEFQCVARSQASAPAPTL